MLDEVCDEECDIDVLKCLLKYLLIVVVKDVLKYLLIVVVKDVLKYCDEELYHSL